MFCYPRALCLTLSTPIGSTRSLRGPVRSSQTTLTKKSMKINCHFYMQPVCSDQSHHLSEEFCNCIESCRGERLHDHVITSLRFPFLDDSFTTFIACERKAMTKCSCIKKHVETY